VAQPRPSLLSDALAIIPRLRQADINEIRATTGLSPEPVLLAALSRSLTLVSNSGEPVGFCGIDPAEDPMLGYVWMVATDRLVKYQREFIRESRKWLDEAHEEYPMLGNFVDARNTLHIRWLDWMGFHFINRFEEWGFERRPFLQFVRIK
jgi:hypothetical protein